MRQVFELWGYEEVFLPSIEEYNSNLRRGLKIAHNNRFYLVKPDITSQIVCNLKNHEILKVYYLSEVLERINGTWQAGIEFIGGRTLQSGIEVLSVVITSLEKLGIENFYIDIGSLQTWKNAVAGLEEHEDKIFSALEKRNLGLIESLPISQAKKEKLQELLHFRGKESGIERLDKIIQYLNDERVFIDLGTIRPLSYYEDLIFEIYSPSFGHPIGGGGEYLVNDLTGFGFAFDLTTLKELSPRKTMKKRINIKGNLMDAYQKARALVNQVC